MKKHYLLLASLLIFSLCFSGCGDDGDNEGSKITTEVTLDNVVIDIPVSVLTTKAETGEFQSFYGSIDDLSIDHPLLADLKPYKNFSIELLVTSVKIKITKVGTGGTTVKNFKSTSTKGTEASYSLETVELNKEFSDTNLTNYLKTIITDVRGGKTVKVDAIGETDVNPDEVDGEVAIVSLLPVLSVKLTLEDYNKIKDKL